MPTNKNRSLGTTKKEVPPTPPSQEQEVLSPLSKFLQESDVLVMFYPKDKNGGFSASIGYEDTKTIYSLVKSKEVKKDSLLIFLDTPGGDAYAAVKIMNILRDQYKFISIGVAEEAKSAGTLMCLGADEIIMSSVSELGPLDKPVLHPINETVTISALDIVRSFDAIIDIALDKQMTFADKILNKKRGIQTKEALLISGSFISKLMSPLLCKEDTKIYNEALRLLKMAERYGSRFLDQYGLKYIKDDSLRKKVVDLILKRLIWEFPDHNFAILRNEVDSELLLLVTKSEEKDYWNELWELFEKNVSKNKNIKFL